ncbi:MAG: antibiotic biosynthesis regulator FhaB [Mycobacteriales bacterium]
MSSALVVAVVKYGLLALLWVFVIAAVRVVRSDLRGSRPATRPLPAPARPAGKGAKNTRPANRTAARRLVVTEGALAGTTISLGETAVTLGRADDSTLVITDDYASSRHARLVPGEGAWLVEDLGSTNGTYLGPNKVTRPTPVPLGQPIRIGKTVMELRR